MQHACVLTVFRARFMLNDTATNKLKIIVSRVTESNHIVRVLHMSVVWRHFVTTRWYKCCYLLNDIMPAGSDAVIWGFKETAVMQKFRLQRLWPSGVWRRAVWKMGANVSEDSATSIFRTEKISLKMEENRFGRNFGIRIRNCKLLHLKRRDLRRICCVHLWCKRSLKRIASHTASHPRKRRSECSSKWEPQIW